MNSGLICKKYGVMEDTPIAEDLNRKIVQYDCWDITKAYGLMTSEAKKRGWYIARHSGDGVAIRMSEAEIATQLADETRRAEFMQQVLAAGEAAATGLVVNGGGPTNKGNAVFRILGLLDLAADLSASSLPPDSEYAQDVWNNLLIYAPKSIKDKLKEKSDE